MDIAETSGMWGRNLVKVYRLSLEHTAALLD
jgi:hypothetical protein